MILTEQEAKNILEKTSRFSKSEGINLTLYGSNSNNIRFALNSISTNGFSDGLSIDITSYFGRKSGSSGTNNFDEESLRKAVEISENIARLSPENPEFVPLLDKQVYKRGINHSENTKNITQENRVDIVNYMITAADKEGLNTAGYLEDNESFTAIYNSNGLFAYNKETSIDFSSTVRTKDGTGSSRSQKLLFNSADLDHKKLTDKAINRSKLSANPAEINPGKYTVILEPDAAADMIAYLFYFMDSRAADEGRSYFSNKSGLNKIGEKIFSEIVNIYSDPWHEKAPGDIFNREGLPLNKTVWINNGRLENLTRSRYWATKNNSDPVPFPRNIIMAGSKKTTEQLISETDHGILVSRLWYIRTVDPRSILLTGLTRDGIFEIRNGKIDRSIKNFRFNESPANMLSKVIDIGISEKASGSETSEMNTFVPALKIKDFNFSSISDAI